MLLSVKQVDEWVARCVKQVDECVKQVDEWLARCVKQVDECCSVCEAG